MLQDRRLNLEVPQFDQGSFYGRFQHFLKVTDCRLLLYSDQQLNEAKQLIERYKNQQEPPGISEHELWKAKYLRDSAFHPDTGEKQVVFGRMSCQVPGGMLVTGAMLSFYRTNTAVIFWQWLNQSFNALVNYTNRNANSPLTGTQMGVAYATATSAALLSALSLKKVLTLRSTSLMQRFVPFVAVSAANSTNIPLMRQSELTNGVAVVDADGNYLTTSRLAAIKGISQVIFSRIVMAAPGMTILPLIMEVLEKKAIIFKRPLVNVVFQTLAVGAFLTVMTPASCAIFDQKCSLSTEFLARWEPDAYQELKRNSPEGNPPTHMFFNKGL